MTPLLHPPEVRATARARPRAATGTGRRSITADGRADLRRARRPGRRRGRAARPHPAAGAGRGRQHVDVADRPTSPRSRTATSVLLAPAGRPVARQLVEALRPRRRRRRRRLASSGATGTAHDLHPDLALLLSTSGLDRLAQAGPALPRQPAAATRPASPTYLGLDPGRPGDHLAAAALLLRPLGASTATCSRRRPRPHRPLGRRRVLLAARGATPAPRRSPACPTPSTCSSAPASPSARLPTCATSPRPAAGCRPERVRALRRARPRARLGPGRHVRPDRGDRPDGLPAAGAGRRAARGDRRPDPGRARSGSTRSPACDRARRRRARLLRAQRDAGVRRRARPTSRSGRSVDRAAHRRPRPASATGCARSSAGAAASPSCSGCGSTSTGSRRLVGRDARGAAAWPSTTSLHAFTDRPPRAPTGCATRSRAATAGSRPARSGCTDARRAAPHRQRQARPTRALRRARRGWSTAADRPRRRRGDTRARPRRVRARPGPARRHGRRQLRRPRRRLAVVRRARDPARRRLGDLPPDWHTRTIADLAQPTGAAPRRRPARHERAAAGARRSWRSSAPTPTCSRSSAARTCCSRSPATTSPASSSPPSPRTARLRHGLASLAQLVVPGALWHRRGRPWSPATTPRPPRSSSTGCSAATTGPRQWQFWFLEALVWISLGRAGAARGPGRRPARAARAVPASRSGWCSPGSRVRFAWAGLEAGRDRALHARRGRLVLRCSAGRPPGRRHHAAPVDGRRPRRGRHRRASSATRQREALIVGGLALLVFVPSRPGAAPARRRRSPTLASASLFIYLTHWQVYPHLEDDRPAARDGALAGRRHRLLAADAAAAAPRRPARPGQSEPPGEADPAGAIRCRTWLRRLLSRRCSSPTAARSRSG